MTDPDTKAQDEIEGRTPHQVRISRAMKAWWRRRRAAAASNIIPWPSEEPFGEPPIPPDASTFEA